MRLRSPLAEPTAAVVGSAGAGGAAVGGDPSGLGRLSAGAAGDDHGWSGQAMAADASVGEPDARCAHPGRVGGVLDARRGEQDQLVAPGGATRPREGTSAARPGPEVWLRLVGLIAALAVAGASTAVWVSRPRSEADQPVPSLSPLLVAEPLASPSPAPSMIVHVVGDVRRPGIVQLPTGARVADAVRAAGGLKRGAELGATNLARLVVDGERVAVGSSADAGSDAGPAATAAPASAAGPVDLNTATAQQLDALPGVGPVTAARILAWRTEHGRFAVVDELAEVAGIGPKTLAELRPHVRV